MPKKYPPDFKRDVARVARRGDLSYAEAGPSRTNQSIRSIHSTAKTVRECDT